MNLLPGSEQSHSMAQNWLKTCLESHTQCAKPRGDFMPTRLLEIEHFHDQTYPRLRLRETFGREFAPYAALSYCWGGEQPITTTSQNINQHLIRINYTGLPKTIQDAITVASRLGLRYLWVDSLCIIQNDRQDKTFEIGQMPSIYSQARVTISASRASNVQEGFLQSRRQLNKDSPYPILEFSYCCQNGERGSIRLVPEVKEGSMEPLSKRGWALQERLLSSRVIEYGSLQTRWICMHEDGTQTDGLRLGVENESGRSDMIFRKALDVISFWGSSFSDASGISGIQRWKSILARYTKLTLTLPTDRLPAISGVAMGFSRILADEYCAGLWKSALIAELFWILDGDEKLLLRRPRVYQAPSWSWAAINDPITFLPEEPFDLIDPQFSVLSVDIQPVKSDLDQYDAKFGAVESGKLVLTGKLKAARWMHPHDPSKLSQWKVLRRPNDRDSDSYLRIKVRPDAIEEEFSTADADHIPVFLLKIIERRSQPDVVVQSRPPMGLMLRRNNELEYTRLGVFEFLLMRKDIYDFKAEFDRYQEQVAWLNDCETQTITIV
jgi:hypothetical protein